MEQNIESSQTAAPPRAEGDSLLRLCWGAAATLLAVLYTIPLAIAAALSGAIGQARGVAWLGRLWARMIIRTAGVKVQFEGLHHIDHLGSFILVANHQSMFDILALLAYFPRPIRFVAKKELLKIPVFGFALKHGNHIVVDREAGGQAVRKAIDVAKSGLCIVFFAEGHRFSDNHVHRFNPGAAWLALQTRLPCVPMAISGSLAIMPRGAKVVRPGRTMRVIVGAPIDTESLAASERNKLTRQLEQAVRELFARSAAAASTAHNRL
jgi:1-acyl-sn-glycerol-3-phosphate acyltransferase